MLLSRARAHQLRWITWLANVAFWIYFGLTQIGTVTRPAHLMKMYVFGGMILVFVVQEYALWAVGKWKNTVILSAGRSE
jgi:hypothetical protein